MSLKTELKQELLPLDRVLLVQPAPNGHGLKALLLKPEIKADDTSTWSQKLQDLVSAEEVALTPYNLHLDYDYWNYHEIMSVIIPENDSEELPTSFSSVGHVAHLNLRWKFQPYKTIIADVLLDKASGIRTVINKIDTVGSESDYRTFSYEFLAGDPDMKVEAKADKCVFRFDYSKVYWNPRLHTEHHRLVDLFHPGEAVCDVMAGVGPFAIPAGKKKVFVWANDLNPESYSSLQDAIKTNKVSKFVQASNEDGRTFIRSTAQALLRTTTKASLPVKPPREPSSGNSTSHSNQRSTSPPSRASKIRKVLTAPKIFSHYIMNLPATAITFLPSFIGLYAGHEALFSPYTETPLPLIHMYCFVSTKDIDADSSECAAAVRTQLCRDIAAQLSCDEFGHAATVNAATVNHGQLVIKDVRDVSPGKRMYCASFRLPAEVAFRRDVET